MNIINLILLLIFSALLIFLIFCIVTLLKEKKLKNNIHFYVARDKNNEIWLYMGKPSRGDGSFNISFCLWAFPDYTFHRFGLNKEDYANLKWEDEPLEVFINIKK